MAGKKNEETINLADMQAQMEAMKEKMLEEAKAEAKAEAEKIIADAKASVSDKKIAELKEAAEKEKSYYNEEVEIELFKDSGKYKDDVFVAVNGVGCLIQRGKKVKVKRKFALALENSINQDKKTSDYIDLKMRELETAESKI